MRSEAPEHRVLRLGLGALWGLDAILQTQPAMWTPAVLIGQIWEGAVQGPAWLTGLMSWSIRAAEPHLALFNAALIATQASLAALLLSGPGRTARLGAWGSLAFGGAVWLFAQGLGGLASPGASLLFGAPGSAFIYAVIAALLLVPAWAGRGASAATAVLLAGGAALQLQAPFWQSVGLSAPIAANFMLTPPALRPLLNLATRPAMAAPVALNLGLIAALLAAAAAAWLAPWSRMAMASVLALLFLLWVTAQDSALLWSGTATDPNTLPAVALLAAAGFAGARGRQRTTGATALGGVTHAERGIAASVLRRAG
jgi:hypothetical protein